MKKKIISTVLILILVSSTIYCDSTEFKDYQDYTIDEFPSWSIKLRRGESLFFGSLALTFPLSVVAYNVVVNSGLISNAPTEELTALKYQVSIAAILSLSIALGDYIIGEME